MQSYVTYIGDMRCSVQPRDMPTFILRIERDHEYREHGLGRLMFNILMEELSSIRKLFHALPCSREMFPALNTLLVQYGFEATEGDFSVSIAAVYNPGLSTDGFTVKGEDGNYVKWNVMGNANMVLGLHPYGVNTEWDNDTFESFKKNNNNTMEEDGAVTLAITVNETTDAKVTVVMIEGDSTTENATALKVEGSTKAGEIYIDGYFVTFSEFKGASVDQTAMGVAASMPMGDLTLSGEFNTETNDDADAAVGLFAKAAFAMGEMNGYGRTVSDLGP